MKKWIGLAILAFLFGCSPSAELQNTLDSFRDQYHIPGAVLLVKTPDSQQIIRSGETAFENGKPIADNTLFGIGSITKLFISALILKLEGQGELSLSDPIGSYFPQYPRWKNITIEQLLNMTSGIPNYTNDKAFKNDLNDNFKKTWTIDNLINISYSQPDDFKPGTDWKYTNTAYLLLGKIIKQVTHVSVSTAFNQAFFSQLKMDHSFYEENAYSQEVFNNMARGYYNNVMVKPCDLVNIGPASGGMVMSAGDLSNFLERLLIKKDLLPKKQVDEMLTGTKLSSGKTGLPNGLFGLGLVLIQDKQLGEMYTFTGTLPTHTATYLIIPEKGIIIVALVAFDRHGDKDTDILFFGRPFFKNVLMNLDIKGLE